MVSNGQPCSLVRSKPPFQTQESITYFRQTTSKTKHFYNVLNCNEIDVTMSREKAKNGDFPKKRRFQVF